MTLVDFEKSFLHSRPFTSDRISEPRLRASDDVRDVHARPFHRLIDRAEEVLRLRSGKGVVVLGPAGVGKSHLLARLFRWSHEGDPGATMVFLHNLLAAPERLPRYLLTSTVSVLSGGRRGDYGDCGLARLWEGAVRAELHLAPEARIGLERAEEALQGLAAAATPLDRAIRRVILRVGMNMFRAAEEAQNVSIPTIEAGLDWLGGDGLEPDQAELLRLSDSGELSEGLRDEQDVERVFRVIAEMSARAGRPFVLALDQIDNLSQDQIRAATRFLHVLIDHTPNFLCVLSGVDTNILPLVDDGVITEANWDRIAEDRVNLGLVSPELARRIVLARLEGFRASFGGVPEIAAAVTTDAFFPLDSRTFRDKLGSALRVRPRQMIRWARDAWEAEAQRCEELGVARWLASWPEGGVGPPLVPWETLVDELTAKRRQEQHQNRLDQPGSLPPDASNLEDLLFRLIEAATQDPKLAVCEVQRAGSGPYDLVLTEESGRRLGVKLVMTRNARASTVDLRRLALDPDPLERVVLVTDEERLPLRQTDRAQEYLDTLQARGEGLVWLKLSFEVHAYIDAIVAVLLQARAGDLELEHRGESRRVTPEDVMGSYIRTGVFSAETALRPLLVLADSASAPPAGGGGSDGPGGGVRGVDPSAMDATLPSPSDCETLLLALASHRPTITPVEAAETWAREEGGRCAGEEVRRRFEQAALRLSLLGRAVLKGLPGAAQLSRWGRWPSLV